MCFGDTSFIRSYVYCNIMELWKWGLGGLKFKGLVSSGHERVLTGKHVYA